MRVHDLDARFSDSVDNVRSGREPAWLGTRYESCCAGARGFRLGLRRPPIDRRSSFQRPLRPSAVQERDVRVPVVIQEPPQPRRVDAAAIVVGDDPGRVRDAERRHRPLEVRGQRHERRRLCRVARCGVWQVDRAGI